MTKRERAQLLRELMDEIRIQKRDERESAPWAGVAGLNWSKGMIYGLRLARRIVHDFELKPTPAAPRGDHE